METKSIIRVFIVFFVVLNLLFCFLYYREDRGAGTLDDEFVFGTVKNLSDRGITVKEDGLHLQKPTNSICMFEKPITDEYCREVADRVSAYSFGEGTQSVSFDVPDGISVSVYEQDSESELAKLLFTGADFGFEYSDSDYELADSSVVFANELGEGISSDQKRALREFVNNLNSDPAFDFYISGTAKTQDGISVSVVQTLDGTPINGMYINAVMWNTRVIFASGKWVTLPISVRYSNTLSDGINVLYELDLESISEITSQRMVYSVRNVDDKRYYLLPTWEISVLDGDGISQILFIDAVK